MTAPVGVLAVLDSLIEYHDTSDSLKGRNCIAARAAVVELIEAATELAEDQVHTDLDEPDYEPETSDAARSRNKGQRIYWRVIAALANVGSAK